MSFQYDQYLANHRANVKRGFDWLCENLPDVTNDISDAAWQIEFAHDKSKDEEDEYNAYDSYFYDECSRKNEGVLRIGSSCPRCLTCFNYSKYRKEDIQ